MNTFLAAAQESLREQYRVYARTEIQPLAALLETHKSSLQNLLKKMGQEGYLGMTVPEEYGGQAMPFLNLVLFVEAISEFEPGLGLSLASHIAVVELLKKYGTDVQKSKYLPMLAKGKIFGTLAIAEEKAGSDFEAIETTLSEVAAPLCEFALSGKKTWVVNGELGPLGVVLARKENNEASDKLSLVLAELKPEAGKLKISADKARLGLRSAYANDLEFEEFSAEVSVLESPSGPGAIGTASMVLYAMDVAKVVLAAAALGLSEGALALALEHARRREQFGKNIGQFQAIQWKIADHGVETAGSRLQTYRAAWAKDEAPKEFQKFAAMSKLVAGKTARIFSGEAMQVLATFGLSVDCPLERFYRDGKTMEIAYGTSEYQKMLIVKEMGINIKMVVLLILIGLSMFWSLPVFADPYFDQGVKLFQKRNYKGAESYFQSAMRTSPGDSNVYYYAALNYHYLADWPHAKAAYRLVVDRFPGTDAAKYAIAALLKIDPNFRAKYATQVAAMGLASGVHNLSSGSSEHTSADYASLPNEAKVYYTDDSHGMIVDVQINGRPVKMVFDTGGGGVVLGKNQLQEFGINILADGPTFTAKGAANGSAVSTKMATGDVKLGLIVRKNFPISILENNSAEPLLGPEFYKDFDYTIDHGSKSISFRKKGAASSATGDSVPFTWDKTGGNKMLVTVQVNGRALPVWLDTGNSASALAMSKKAARQAGLDIPDDAQQAQTAGVTGTGNAMRFSVRRMKLGPIEKTDVEVTVNEEDNGGKPLLGQSFLEGWQFTVDNAHMRLNFLRR